MGITYQQSGVDIDAANLLIKRIRDPVAKTNRQEILTELGGFASLATLPTKYKQPVLVCGTDGVGTKVELAIEYDRHEVIGQDLVAMCVNDILVYRAEPLLFLDYFATAKLDVDIAERVIIGIADACKQVGCALAGGETAELPGLYAPNIYDLAGFCVGVVEKETLDDRSTVQIGDTLLGLASDGPHSNGYSLIRKLLQEHKAPAPIIEELLTPTRLYGPTVLNVANLTTGMAHITGGGLIENPPRMLTEELAIELKPNVWEQPESFEWINAKGQLEPIEMMRTFNCGIGFVIATRQEDSARVKAEMEAQGERVYTIGRVVARDAKPHPDSILLTK
ncbi:MAG: phosphoribosylformylglycinamidine cyclo-ligase [Gammaproteobacteria bacterium]|nr:phosphoribosylformylglycinamidine cyclo-ligase [Gammaproteobacteria bacterium]